MNLGDKTKQTQSRVQWPPKLNFSPSRALKPEVFSQFLLKTPKKTFLVPVVYFIFNFS